MPYDPDLELSTEELRTKFSSLNHLDEILETKVIGLLAIELATATFLFATDGFMPRERYGKIFYDLAVGGFGAALVLSILCISPVIRLSPPGLMTLSKRVRNKFKGDDFLELIKDDYEKAYEGIVKTYSKRWKRFAASLCLFIATVIMLIIIKYGQG